MPNQPITPFQRKFLEDRVYTQENITFAIIQSFKSSYFQINPYILERLNIEQRKYLNLLKTYDKISLTFTGLLAIRSGSYTPNHSNNILAKLEDKRKQLERTLKEPITQEEFLRCQGMLGGQTSKSIELLKSLIPITQSPEGILDLSEVHKIDSARNVTRFEYFEFDQLVRTNYLVFPI